MRLERFGGDDRPPYGLPASNMGLLEPHGWCCMHPGAEESSTPMPGTAHTLAETQESRTPLGARTLAETRESRTPLAARARTLAETRESTTPLAARAPQCCAQKKLGVLGSPG